MVVIVKCGNVGLTDNFEVLGAYANWETARKWLPKMAAHNKDGNLCSRSSDTYVYEGCVIGLMKDEWL